jgi:hypothetical protein
MQCFNVGINCHLRKQPWQAKINYFMETSEVSFTRIGYILHRICKTFGSGGFILHFPAEFYLFYDWKNTGENTLIEIS